MDGNTRQKADNGLDETSRALLTRLQGHIPLDPRPFLRLGEELGLAEAEVIARTSALSESRLIRQISAIFDGSALGYRSSLVAARYEPEALDAAARLISSHPGVSHNYRRDHDFNLWYTIAVPPGEDLDQLVDELHRRTAAAATRLLPSVRLFKLGVRLDLEEGPAPARAAPAGPGTARAAAPAPLPSEAEVRVVKAFQDPFPVTERPFDRAAEVFGFASTEALLEAARDLHRRGILRRFAAVLRHREAGYRANGMVVWKASPEECDAAGPVMARYSMVSHCYQRPTYPDWPYSLFSMIHGRTPDDVQACVDAIRAETGLGDYRILYSSTEYKKARVRYFTEDWERWRSEAARWDRPTGPRAKAGPGEDRPAGGGSGGPSIAERRLNRMRIWGHLQGLQACLWEIASLSRADFDAIRESAKLHAGMGMLLTSCQRLEAYSLQGCNCGAATRLHGFDALLHLAEVASGLHSVVLGEDQIAGQVRTALAEAPAGVRELGDIALATARELRREAAFDSHAGHLLDRGLSAAGVEPGGRFLVVGTGHMGRLIAGRAHEIGFDSLLVAGRRPPESPWLEALGAAFVPLESLAKVEPVDVLVGCLGSQAGELDPARDLPIVRRLILDFGTPRNFRGAGTAPVLAIEDLLTHVAGTGHRRERVAALRQRLRERLERRLQMAALDSQSTVGAVRLELERRRQEEVERIRRLHPELGRDLIDTITRSLVNRLFHGFSAGLKQIDDIEFHEQILALFTGSPADARETAATGAR